MENKKKKVIIGSTAALAALGTAAGIAVPLATSSSKVKTTGNGHNSTGTEINPNIGSQQDGTTAVPAVKDQPKADANQGTKVSVNKPTPKAGDVLADHHIVDTVAAPVQTPMILIKKNAKVIAPDAPEGWTSMDTPDGTVYSPISPKGPIAIPTVLKEYADPKFMPEIPVQEFTLNIPDPIKTPIPTPHAAPTKELIDLTPEKTNPVKKAAPYEVPTLAPIANPAELPTTPQKQTINWTPEATMEQAVTTHDKKQTPRDSKLYVPKTQGAHLAWKEQEARLARMTAAMKSMFTAETNQEENTEARFAHHPFELKNAYEKAQAKFNAAEARYNIYLATAKKTEEMNLFFDVQTEEVQNGETESVSQLSDDKTNEEAAKAAFNEERDRYNAHLEMERKTLAMTEFYGTQSEIANDLAKARMDHSFGYDNAFDKAEAKFNAEKKAFETTNNKIADENIKNNVVGFEESVAAQIEIASQEDQKNIDKTKFVAQKAADRKAQEAKVAKTKAKEAAERLAIAEEAKARRTAEEAQAASQVASALSATEHNGLTTDAIRERQNIIMNAVQATVESEEFSGRAAATKQAKEELETAKANEAVATGNAIIARAKFEAEQQRIAAANAAIAGKEAQSLKAEQAAIEKSKAADLKTKVVAGNAELATSTVQTEEDKAAEAQFKANTIQSNKDVNAKRTFEAELNTEEEIAGVDATIRGDRNVYDSSLEAIKKQDQVDQKAWEDKATAEQIDIQEAKAERARYGASVEAAEQARANSLRDGDLLAKMANPEVQVDDNKEIAKGDAMEKKAAEDALAWEQEQYRKQYGKAMEIQQSGRAASDGSKQGTGDYQVNMQAFKDTQDIAKGNAMDQQAAQEAAAWVKQQQAKISYTEPKTVISKQQLPPTTGFEVNGVVYATEQEAKTALDIATTVKQSWYIGSTKYDSLDELRKAADDEVPPLEEVELGKNGMQDGDEVFGIPKAGRPETGFVYNGISYKTKAEAEAAWLVANPVVQTASGRVQQITLKFTGEDGKLQTAVVQYKLAPGQAPLHHWDVHEPLLDWRNGQESDTPYGYDMVYIPKGAKLYTDDHNEKVYKLVPGLSTATRDVYIKVASSVVADSQMTQETYQVGRNAIDRGAGTMVEGQPRFNKYAIQNPFGDNIIVEYGSKPDVSFQKAGYQGYTVNINLYVQGKFTGITSVRHLRGQNWGSAEQMVISLGTATQSTGTPPQESAERIKAADAEIEQKLFTTASPDQGTEEKFLIPYGGFTKGWSYEGKFYHEKVTAETIRNAAIDAQHHTYVTYVVNGQEYMNRIAAYSQQIKRITVTDRSVFNHEVKAPSTSAGTLY